MNPQKEKCVSFLTTPWFLKGKTIACYHRHGLPKQICSILPYLYSLYSAGWVANIFLPHLWNTQVWAPAHFLYSFPSIIAFHFPTLQPHSTLPRAPRNLCHTSAFGTCFSLTKIPSTLTCLAKFHSSLKIQLTQSLLWKDIHRQPTVHSIVFLTLPFVTI